jgi:outer membrane lipoprotein LolB
MNGDLLPFIGNHQQRPRPVARLLLTVLLLGLGVSACSSLAPPAQDNTNWIQQRNRLQQLGNWQLRGRVNVRYQNESHTPRIQWQQQQQDFHIRLWGTFNAGNTSIDGGPGFVSLEQDGVIVTATSPEDLILQQLGYELPVSYLEYWIRGLPAPHSNADLSFNELNQLAQMEQDGWTISYTDPRQYGAVTLPRRVDVTRPRDDVSLRFVGLSWTLEDSPN